MLYLLFTFSNPVLTIYAIVVLKMTILNYRCHLLVVVILTAVENYLKLVTLQLFPFLHFTCPILSYYP